MKKVISPVSNAQNLLCARNFGFTKKITENEVRIGREVIVTACYVEILKPLQTHAFMSASNSDEKSSDDVQCRTKQPLFDA